MSKRLRLSWGRFLYVMALLAVAPILITWTTVQIDAAVFMLWILYASGFAFFALGWRRMRQEDAADPLRVSDLDRARRALLGKPWVAAAWFMTTLVAVLSLTIGSVLYGAAA